MLGPTHYRSAICSRWAYRSARPARGSYDLKKGCLTWRQPFASTQLAGRAGIRIKDVPEVLPDLNRSRAVRVCEPEDIPVLAVVDVAEVVAAQVVAESPVALTA